MRQYTKHNIIWLLTWCEKYNLVTNNIYIYIYSSKSNMMRKMKCSCFKKLICITLDHLSLTSAPQKIYLSHQILFSFTWSTIYLNNLYHWNKYMGLVAFLIFLSLIYMITFDHCQNSIIYGSLWSLWMSFP